MIPKQITHGGVIYYSVSETRRILADDYGCDVTREWLYRKVSGRDKQNTTFTYKGNKRQYAYKIPAILKSGVHCITHDIGRRQFIYINGIGIQLLRSEHKANKAGGTLGERYSPAT